MTAANTPYSALDAQELECIRGDSVIFQDLNLCAERGQVVQIVGANGTGKSSLLRLLAGLSDPASGVIRWHGRDIALDRRAWQQTLHYIGHLNGVTANLTVMENLEFARALADRTPGMPLNEALAQVGLGACGHQLAGRLSAGQRQRAALARLLLVPAEVWLLDEPLTALDQAGKALFETMLVQHVASGGLAIVATHHTLSVPRDIAITFDMAQRS